MQSLMIVRGGVAAVMALEPPTEDALNSIAGETKIGRSDLIARILREWLETNAYLPVHEFFTGWLKKRVDSWT